MRLTKTTRGAAYVCTAFRMMALAVVASPLSAWAQTSDHNELLGLINALRGAEEQCGGGPGKAVGPLAPNASLALPPARSGEQLQQALRRTGYRPARLQAISVVGPTDARSAMRALEQRYCEILRSQDYAEVGVSREGNTWQVLLAKPLLPPDLGSWKRVGQEILERVNDARGKPRQCGGRSFEPAAPLSWDGELAQAALEHSRDMAKKDYFSHRAPGGSLASDRASRAGYRWQQIGENIAAGQGSAEQVVAGWLASPGHCANIMNPGFTEMGAAYATSKGSAAGSYWTQVFGTPR
jgi:uncharacterized protein YkwD